MRAAALRACEVGSGKGDTLTAVNTFYRFYADTYFERRLCHVFCEFLETARGFERFFVVENAILWSSTHQVHGSLTERKAQNAYQKRPIPASERRQGKDA